MEVKVNAQNWAELDFLINNFYEIVEYKRGRGIYGDRVILKRSKRPECIFGEKDKYYEFYYLNAHGQYNHQESHQNDFHRPIVHWQQEYTAHGFLQMTLDDQARMQKCRSVHTMHPFPDFRR